MPKSRPRVNYKKQKRKQVVLTEPAKLFQKRYLTNKGMRLLLQGKISEEEADKKYGKNKYVGNPDAVPFRENNGKVRVIKH